MSNVAEFIAARESIETLVKQITMTTGHIAIQESKGLVDEARRQLLILSDMVNNDVQVIVEGRLTRVLAGLGTRVDKLLAKQPVKRKKAEKKDTKTAKVKAPAEA